MENWQQVQEIFVDAIRRTPEERLSFLDRVCSEDKALRNEIESLLFSYDSAGSFLETPAVVEIAESIVGERLQIEKGHILGHYQISEQIGAGGMGEVYLAYDNKLDRKVALKILPADVALNRSRVNRFFQEAKAVSALNHPNILTIYEVDETDSSLFIATEFIDGETLSQRLKGRRLNLTEVLELTIQIAGALAAAHDAGIIHRDIKPENIMIRRDGFVKVLDFGLAKLTERELPELVDTEATTKDAVNTDPGVIMGTAPYMSPEQVRGLQVDGRSDIFSFGVVIYEMLAGRTPFGNSNTQEILASIISDKMPPPLTRYADNLPTEIQRIITKALSKKRGERYQTAKDILLDLKSLNDDLTFARKLESSVPQNESGEFVTAKSTHSDDVSGAAYFVSKMRKHKQVTAIVVLFLLVSIGIVSRFFISRSSSVTTIDSIAVMPFENVTHDQDIEYLSDGITDSLINNLSRLPRMKVIARNSVFSYKGKVIDPQTVGRELNVQAILTGRITKQGENLSISVELIDIGDKRHIWGGQYNRKISDLLNIQDEISSGISQSLRSTLTSEEQSRVNKRYTDNIEAYQLYLKGRYFADQYTEEGFNKAVDRFNEAIKIDPNFALAYAGLAEAYWLVSAQSKSPREAMPKAREYALKAISLDETLAEGHTALASVQAFYDYDFFNAEKEFRRAIELNPGSASSRQWYGWYLAGLKRADESQMQLKQAKELDPLSLVINGELGMPFFFTRQYDKAIEQYKRAMEIDPNNLLARIGLAMAYIKKEMYEEAIVVTSEAESDDSFLLAANGHAYARLGNKAEAKKAIAKLKEQAKKKYVPSYALALVYIGLGQKEESLELLEKSYENREDGMVWLNSDPILDDLRSEPRFQELVRRVGFP